MKAVSDSYRIAHVKSLRPNGAPKRDKLPDSYPIVAVTYPVTASGRVVTVESRAP